MNPKTQRALNTINQVFYATVADDFSATRREPWPGWERVLQASRVASPASPLRVLDLGCGNARFASFLLDRDARSLHYVGVDASEPLLEHARRAHAGTHGVELLLGDVLDSAQSPDPPPLPPGPFDLVVLFGLLHHVPGFESRRALLSRALERLRPGGLLAVAAWRFGAAERFEKRRLSWEAFNETRLEPIDLEQLEPGDHLLQWADAATPRYCHFSDREEMAALHRGLPVELLDEFDSDGKSGDLNHYCVSKKL